MGTEGIDAGGLLVSFVLYLVSCVSCLVACVLWLVSLVLRIVSCVPLASGIGLVEGAGRHDSNKTPLRNSPPFFFQVLVITHSLN